MAMKGSFEERAAHLSYVAPLIAALLIRLGVLDPAHPVAIRFMTGPVTNWAGDAVGRLQPVTGITG